MRVVWAGAMLQAAISTIKTFPARRPLLFGIGFSCAPRTSRPVTPRPVPYVYSLFTAIHGGQSYSPKYTHLDSVEEDARIALRPRARPAL